MCIINYKSVIIQSIACYGACISCHVTACYNCSISNSYTIFLHVCFCKSSFPVVFCCKCYFVSCCLVICIEFNFNRCRTDSILVVCIVPLYRCRNHFCQRNIKICNYKSVYIVTLDNSFIISSVKINYLNCVLDLFANFSGSVLLKSIPFICESIIAV